MLSIFIYLHPTLIFVVEIMSQTCIGALYIYASVVHENDKQNDINDELFHSLKFCLLACLESAPRGAPSSQKCFPPSMALGPGVRHVVRGHHSREGEQDTGVGKSSSI